MRWNDQLGFYLYQTRVEPRSVKATQLAMLELLEAGRLDEAESLARRSVELRPDGDDVHLQLAVVLMRRGAWAEAQEAIDRARLLNPPGRWGVYQDELDAQRRDAGRHDS
jgi:Flp pilus assembly protein TadD